MPKDLWHLQNYLIALMSRKVIKEHLRCSTLKRNRNACIDCGAIIDDEAGEIVE